MTGEGQVASCTCDHDAERHGPEAGGCIECRCRSLTGRVASGPRVRKGVLYGVPCHNPESHKRHRFIRGDQPADCEGRKP